MSPANKGEPGDMSISSGNPISMRVYTIKEISRGGVLVPVNSNKREREREREKVDTLIGLSLYPCGFPAEMHHISESPFNHMKKQISNIYAPLTEMELAKLYTRLLAANPSRKFKLNRVYSGAGASCRAATAATSERAMQTLARMGLAKKGAKTEWELLTP